MTSDPPTAAATDIPHSALRTPHSVVGPGICEAAMAGLLLLLMLVPNSLLNSDGDTAHHLAAGRQMLETGSLTPIDIFTQPHFGQPWINWEWLSDVLFALANGAAGLNGVALLAVTLIAGTVYALCRWCMARGLHPVPTLVLGLLATTTSEIHWLARPHLFSFALLLLVLYLLEEYRTGRSSARRLALIPPIMVVWANLHAGFVMGLVLCGAYGLGALLELGRRRWMQRLPAIASRRAALATPRAHLRAYTLTGLAATAATLLNPYGWGLYAHIIEFLRNPLITHITVEFQPLDFRYPITWSFLVLVGVMLVVVARTWRWLPPSHALLLAAGTVLALQVARNVSQFSIIAPALLAPLIQRWIAERAGRQPSGFWARYGTPAGRLGIPWLFIGTLALLLGVAALGGSVGPWPLLRAAWTEPPLPIRAVATLRAPDAPQGPMFNDMTWGGYLLYELYPQRRVFIDSQVDVYGATINHDYLTIATTAAGWDGLLDHYGIAWVIQRPTSPLVAALHARPDQWRETYRDSTAVILQRR
ncbi:MAG: hypothetical protein M3Z04_12555 [Chloroflexota bacterium]|nr:hypothetical protein [Chloroflexota bacterium]